jgi:hypothetical protein
LLHTRLVANDNNGHGAVNLRLPLNLEVKILDLTPAVHDVTNLLNSLRKSEALGHRSDPSILDMVPILHVAHPEHCLPAEQPSLLQL